MAEASTRTWEDDPVADIGLAVLDGAVYSDALIHTYQIGNSVDLGELELTAHRIDAASALPRFAGIGVTCLT